MSSKIAQNKLCALQSLFKSEIEAKNFFLFECVTVV